MIRCIKNELWELRHSKSFGITVLIGIMIVCTDMVQNYSLYIRYMNIWQGQTLHIGYDSINLFNRWICVNLDTIGYAWFFLLFPILAALSFSCSYCKDKNSGFLKQIIIRIGRRNYFCSKIVAVFIAGCFSVGVPLLVDLLGTALILPACIPDVTSMQTPIWSGYYLSKIFYSSPWLYSFLSILTDMLWAGTIAVMAFSVGCIKTNNLFVLCTPFILFLIEDYIAITFTLSQYSEADTIIWSPLALLHPATINPNPGWLIFCLMGVHLVFALTIIFYKGVRSEVY